jgi:tetratricopeptide (TPR) repeat protein
MSKESGTQTTSRFEKHLSKNQVEALANLQNYVQQLDRGKFTGMIGVDSQKLGQLFEEWLTENAVIETQKIDPGEGNFFSSLIWRNEESEKDIFYIIRAYRNEQLLLGEVVNDLVFNRREVDAAKIRVIVIFSRSMLRKIAAHLNVHSIALYVESFRDLQAPLEQCKHLDIPEPEKKLAGDTIKEVSRQTTENRISRRELLTLAHQAKKHYRLEEAETLYRQVLDLEGETGNKDPAPRQALGMIYRDLGQIGQALSLLEEAFTLCRHGDDLAGQTLIKRCLGLTCFDQGRFVLARDHFESGLELARLSGNELERASLLTCLGATHRELGNKEQAVQFTDKAIEIYRRLEDMVGEANVLSIKGRISRDQNQFEDAMNIFEHAFRIYSGRKRLQGVATTLGEIGLTYFREEDPGSALLYHQKALDIFEGLGLIEGRTNSLHHLGNCHHRLGDRKQAVEYFEKALSLHVKVEDIAGQAVVFRDLGRVFIQENELGKADSFLDKSLIKAKELLKIMYPRPPKLPLPDSEVEEIMARVRKGEKPAVANLVKKLREPLLIPMARELLPLMPRSTPEMLVEKAGGCVEKLQTENIQSMEQFQQIFRLELKQALVSDIFGITSTGGGSGGDCDPDRPKSDNFGIFAEQL